MTQFEIVERQVQPALVVKGTVAFADLPSFFGRAFTAVVERIESAGSAPSGPGFGYYPSMPTDVVEVWAGFPAEADVEPGGEVEAIELPAGRAVRAIHVGPFETLEQTYGELAAWMAAQQLVPATAMWESYLTDPDAAPPAEWETEIVWPLQG